MLLVTLNVVIDLASLSAVVTPSRYGNYPSVTHTDSSVFVVTRVVKRFITVFSLAPHLPF